MMLNMNSSYSPLVWHRRSGTTTYSHSALKNNAAQSGTGQTVAATRTYDAFGNVVASTGTFKGPFGYAGPFGYQEAGDSGLKLLGHRYYDSSTGRFLTRDPIKDGRNWYVYCDSNPLEHVDVSGLSPQLALAVAALASDDPPLPIPPKGQIERSLRLVDLVLEQLIADYESDFSHVLPGGGVVAGTNYLVAKMEWFAWAVTDGGHWDFKSDDPRYQDYGNWHYGVVGVALGFSDNMLLGAAGINQIMKDGLSFGNGIPFLWGNHGDHERDVRWIKRGIRWARRNLNQ